MSYQNISRRQLDNSRVCHVFVQNADIHQIFVGTPEEKLIIISSFLSIENKDRWDDRIMPPLRTNLIDTYLLLKEFINKHLPEKFYLEGDQRIDLRDKIFREVVGNLCCHCEYTSPVSSELIITETEVTMTNPNKAIFHGILNPNSFNPSPKNPNIRKFFTAFGWADEIGSGVRNTNKYLPRYSYGARPTFT